MNGEENQQIPSMITEQPSPKSFNKKTFILLGILLIFLTGGVMAYQYWWAPKEEEKALEGVIEDETANWEVYRNEEYGFEIGHPKGQTLHFWEKESLLGEKELYGVSFGSWCYSKNEQVVQEAKEKDFMEENYDWNMGAPIVINSFGIKVSDNSQNLPLDIWIKKYEFCGNKNDWAFQKFGFKGIDSIQIHDVGTCAPGAGGKYYAAYVPQNRKIYSVWTGGEPIYSNKEGVEECRVKEKEMFDQMLSTFKFIEKEATEETELPETIEPNRTNETIGWKTYRNEEYGYDIKYPLNWLNFGELWGGFSIISPTIEGRSDNQVRIIPDKREGEESNQEYIDNMIKDNTLPGYMELKTKKEITINDIEGYEIIWNSLDSKTNQFRETELIIYMEAPLDNKARFIIAMLTGKGSQYEVNLETFNQMLSTFRFLE